MHLVDLPPAVFCGSSDIGQHFVAGRNSQFRMFHFRDCLVDMQSRFPIAPGGRVCTGMFGLYEGQKYEPYFSDEFALELQRHTQVDLEYGFVLGGSPNYWHFLVDHLSTLALLPSFGHTGLPTPTLVANATLTPDYVRLVETVCAFLNVARPNAVAASQRFMRLRNSYVPCRSPLGPRLEFLRDLGRSIQSAAQTPSPERIFLRRGSVSRRRITNETELEGALAREFGFVAIDPGGMSAFDQMRLMRKAHLVIGGHGAALTNVIFGVDLEHVVELYGGATQPFFKAVCDHWQIGHHFVPGAGLDAAERDPGRPDNQDYSIDVYGLLKLVETL
jgi:hypothetical protein